MFKIINWYTQRFSFPYRGWKFFRRFLEALGLYHLPFIRRLHNGALIHTIPSEHIQQQLFWHGYYEKEAVLTWEAMLDAGSVCLDIGANTGYYSLIAARRAKKVYAFEPSTVNREWLNKNIALNSFSNIEVEALALGDQNGEAILYNSADTNSGMSGLRPPGNFDGNAETVTLTNVDHWSAMKRVEKIDCIKIDVEGAEMNVLMGMNRVTDLYKPVIFIEVMAALLNKYDHTPADVFQFLWVKGYKAYSIPAPGRLLLLPDVTESYNIVFIHQDHTIPGNIQVM